MSKNHNTVLRMAFFHTDSPVESDDPLNLIPTSFVEKPECDDIFSFGDSKEEEKSCSGDLF